MTAASASKGDYVFTMKDGSPFDFGSYRKPIWNTALDAAGPANKVPYSARHSLVQWSLVVGMVRMNTVIEGGSYLLIDGPLPALI